MSSAEHQRQSGCCVCRGQGVERGIRRFHQASVHRNYPAKVRRRPSRIHRHAVRAERRGVFCGDIQRDLPSGRMKRLALLVLILAGCRDLLVFPDAQMDVVDVPDVVDIVDAPQDISTDVYQCSVQCPGGWTCAERLPGQFLCEPIPSGGSCPPGWQVCAGRCWGIGSPLHCASCSDQCSSAQTCRGLDDGGWACM